MKNANRDTENPMAAQASPEEELSGLSTELPAGAEAPASTEQTAPAECLQATITVLNQGAGGMSLEEDVFGPEPILALQTADGSVVGKVLQFDDGLHGSLDPGAQTTGAVTLAYSPSGSYGARFDDETGAYYYDYTTSGITDLCLLAPSEHLFSWHLPSNRP